MVVFGTKRTCDSGHMSIYAYKNGTHVITYCFSKAVHNFILIFKLFIVHNLTLIIILTKKKFYHEKKRTV